MGPLGRAAEGAFPLFDCLGHRSGSSVLLQGCFVRPAVCAVARRFHLLPADGVDVHENGMAVAVSGQLRGFVHQHGTGGAVHDTPQGGAMGGIGGDLSLSHRATLRLHRACLIRQGEAPCRTYYNMGHPIVRPRCADELLHHLPFRVSFPLQLSGLCRGAQPDRAFVLRLYAAHAQPLDGHIVRDPHCQLFVGQGGTAQRGDFKEISPTCHRGHCHCGGGHHPDGRCRYADARHRADLFAV